MEFGYSGMLVEAYLEYTFTQGLVDEIATIVCDRFNQFRRSTIGDPLYAYLLKITITLVIIGLFIGILASGFLPDSWHQGKIAICWLYALRYVLQAALEIKLLCQEFIQYFACYWNPAFDAMMKAIVDSSSSPSERYQP